MDPKSLPFDTDRMLSGLRPWVECESPTWDVGAVNRMMGLVARELASLGAGIEVIPGHMGFGDCVRARLPHSTRQPGILILGHFDTVHPVGTLAQLPWRRDDEKCYGPGICDMKGGNFIAVEALRQLLATGVATELPITLLFTPDEEVGSPSSRDLIEAEATRHKYVLVPEPAFEQSGVITGRYAIARFNLETTGRPSHAGVKPSEGRSAILEMARRIIEIHAMNGDDCTFSTGVVRGGRWVNCVTTTCAAEVLSMAKRQHDLDQGVERMLALNGTRDDVAFKVTRGVTRPVWEPDARTMALYEHARELATGLGPRTSPRQCRRRLRRKLHRRDGSGDP